MNLREAFNRMDHAAIDNNQKFYDLRGLVESVNLTPEDRQTLKQFVDKNDPEGANTYLQGLLSKENNSGQTNKTIVASAEGELSENRSTLRAKPLRTKAQNSKKIRYEIVDTATNTPAVYLTPYTYDTKKAANKAIKDKNNDFNYLDSGRSAIEPAFIKDTMKKKRKSKKKKEKDKNSMNIKKQHELDEALFLEASDRLSDDDVMANEELASVYQMLHSPRMANGDLKVEAKILLAIYAQTLAVGVPYTTREAVLRQAGVPEPDRDRQAQTYFNFYKDLDLAEAKGGFANSPVYPGNSLEAWVKGTPMYFPANCTRKANGKPLAGEKYGSGEDLTSEVNKTFGARPSQGAKPKRSPNGRLAAGAESSEAPEITTFNTEPVFPESAEIDQEISDEVDKLWAQMFGESLSLKEDTESTRTDDHESAHVKRVKKLWREYSGLPEDAPIPFRPIEVNGGAFFDLCFKNNLSPGKVSRILYGDNYTTGYTADELRALSEDRR